MAASENTPLNHARHGQLGWVPPTDYFFARHEHIVPIVAAEINKAVQCFPLAFVKQEERFILAAVLSPLPQRNIYVSTTGKWVGNYIPAHFRSHPFYLVKPADKENHILCVDESTNHIGADKPNPIYMSDFRMLAPMVQTIFDFLVKVEQDRILTQQAVDALDAAGVLTEWQLSIKLNSKQTPVTGLYCIDEKKIESLSNGEYLKLRQAQGLPLVYAQLISMKNIHRFFEILELSRDSH